MKFSKSDFPLMRWSLVAICASLLLSGVMLYSSNKYADLPNNISLRAAQRKLNDARNAFDHGTPGPGEPVGLFPGIWRTGKSTKSSATTTGWTGWMGLEKLRQQNLVIDFRYNIAPQKIYAPQPAIDSGNFDIHYSEMKLQFDLLHEGQLLNFFDALRSQTNGQYQLEGCTLQRADVNEECCHCCRYAYQGRMQRRLDHTEKPECPAMRSLLKIGLCGFALTVRLPPTRNSWAGYFSPRNNAHSWTTTMRASRARPTMPATQLMLNGIVQMHGGKRTVWINGVPQTVGRSDEKSPESVPVPLPGQNKSVKLKVGQRVLLNPAANPMRPVHQDQNAPQQ